MDELRLGGDMLKNSLPGALLKRYLIYGPFLLLCGTASAQTIYKWTDKTGKVHYGDSTSSPKDTTPLVTKAGENSSAAAPAVSGEAPKLQKCLAMARQMVDQKNRPTPSEIRSRSNELL